MSTPWSGQALALCLHKGFLVLVFTVCSEGVKNSSHFACAVFHRTLFAHPSLLVSVLLLRTKITSGAIRSHASLGFVHQNSSEKTGFQLLFY